MNKLAMGLVILGLSTIVGAACSMEKKQEAETTGAMQEEQAAPAAAQQPAQAVEVEEVQAEAVEE